jgi:membrane protein YdbS with pleckstrin-like domain
VREEPKERLDPRAKALWRLSGLLEMLPVLAAGAGTGWAAARFGEQPPAVAAVPVLVTLLATLINALVLPELRWRRWRYEIREDEVDLQRGVFWVVRTLVPFARIQHVDTRSGPLQRRFGLATVVFYTAAGPNRIPELSAPVAAEVRDRIAELTRERDEL